MPARTLSEADSKILLAAHGVPFAPEHVVDDVDAAVGAALEVGLPVVLKLNGDAIVTPAAFSKYVIVNDTASDPRADNTSVST